MLAAAALHDIRVYGRSVADMVPYELNQLLAALGLPDGTSTDSKIKCLELAIRDITVAGVKVT